MRELNYDCDLNVLAEFKKFDVHKVHRGIVTKDCVANVLRSEDVDSALAEGLSTYFMRHDLDRDGKITFKELYDSMMKRIPQEWLEWIANNLKSGVKEETILKVLLANGIEEKIATNVIQKTKTEGQQFIQRSFADFCKSYIYVMKS